MKFVQPLWTVVCQFFKKLKYLHKRIEHICPHRDVIVQLPSQSCQILCDPMDCSRPRVPVPHHLPKFAQVHVHCTGDATQPSHPLMPSSPSALNLSQHQGLFQWVGCSRQMTKILELQLQHQSCQRVLSVDLRLPGLLSLLSRGLSGVFSSNTVWRHQFFGILEEGTANHSSILAIRTSRTDDSLGWLIYSFCTWAFSFSISILGHHPSRCKGTPWILLV